MSRRFTCKSCGRHELKAKVTFIADVKKFDQEGSFFILGNEMEPEEVTFLCLGCGWETISPTFEQDL